MHLLQAQAGGIADGSEAVDLGQTPGDIVVLSAADTELASLAAARETLGEDYPELRLASLLNLSHNLSVDLYLDQVVSRAKLVVLRLLGGAGYWSYGCEEVTRTAKEKGIALALLPGDDQPDAELARLSTLQPEAYHRLWQYLVQGGAANARSFLAYAANLIGYEQDWAEPRPLLKAGLYDGDGGETSRLEDLQANWPADAPVAALVFYRALVQAGNTAPVDSLVQALKSRGLAVLPVYVSSLKDPVSRDTLAALFGKASPDIILNGTGFAVATPGTERVANPFDRAGCPVFQVVFSGGTEAAWESGSNGLSARDIAMNVALPEVDGRIFTRAVSFKSQSRRDEKTQCPIVTYSPRADRIAFVADLAARWVALRRKSPAERRLALIFANYPNRDGRIGNGVGLDAPAGALQALRALKAAGYDTGALPESGDALIRRLQEGPTNAGFAGRRVEIAFSRAAYELFFASLPERLRAQVLERWGGVEQDPFFLRGELDCGSLAMPAFHLGRIVVAVQPARGYNIDPKESYHDPALVPPHNYLAFYAWLREEAGVDAVIHMGKHGNLEWLPGKSLALSEDCFPEAAFGPMPHFYPFIVNDPGEGTQAKRRSQAVIVDHLTPPLTRAESYGPLADLERLVDEYYEAAGLDPRRLKLLRREILELVRHLGLDKDCGIDRDEAQESALAKLDNYLCELKELQIRDGLHIFGRAPEGEQLQDLLVALTRLPRGDGQGENASLLRALAADLGLTGQGENAFDPLDCRLGELWQGPQPTALRNLLPDVAWRSKGDTVERLELLAKALVSAARPPDAAWTKSAAVLRQVEERIRPAVSRCGEAELAGLTAGLAGRFLEPGPSGAPTRGRPDVLPTGRNFYSVDTRVVPTPAAWELGWKSASRLLERHRQEQGAWPKRLAISCWGTANMRTGGDDIAQALALLGVKPTWDAASRRITGFEILPLSVLGRPRVDVMLRVSGFFRDAFPAQIDLFDSAVRAVARLEEAADGNPLAAAVAEEGKAFLAAGRDAKEAELAAGFRVFRSKPGAYGAGLQALIDEKGWSDTGDLARAYIAWGGFAYGGGAQGKAAQDLFEARLAGVQVVVQNQDNREHDLLDSDDYYQFEGGLAAAVKEKSGAAPSVYHNDHSRPESPQIRSLSEEIGRVVRARVVNPKWIRGVMRHGYKGAFEMAATVDYIFAFAATTGAVQDHHFDLVYDAYIADEKVQEFLGQSNPAARREMAERLIEAQDRGLWRPRSNSARATLAELAGEKWEEAS